MVVLLFKWAKTNSLSIYRNLARMCQIPVMNPMRTAGAGEFEDPSEPIYTDPSLFERSR